MYKKLYTEARIHLDSIFYHNFEIFISYEANKCIFNLNISLNNYTHGKEIKNITNLI